MATEPPQEQSPTHPRHQGKTARWFTALTGSYAAILAGLTLLNRLGPERWWFTAFNLYLPQAIWLIPGLFLLVICLLSARRRILLPLLCVAWVAGPLMGFCWPGGEVREWQEGVPLRVMTWNIKYGLHGTPAQQALRRDIDAYTPDVVMFQDATNMVNGPLAGYFRQWYLHSQGQFVIASRFPLSGAQALPIELPWGRHTCMRYQLRAGSTDVTLYNVHFESPRVGLSAVTSSGRRPSHLPMAIQRFEQNVLTRLVQGRIVREFIRRERGPVILAGDLNSPDASLVCAGLREIGLHDAFREGGRGYGYTYGHFLLQHRLPWLRSSWMRIDHIMMNSRFRTVRCWTGTGDASDHRPVIADLILKPLSQIVFTEPLPFTVSVSNRYHLANTGLRQAQAERHHANICMERSTRRRPVVVPWSAAPAFP
jgi:endonuclease/exonuclease/phosphatase (EEP) superfamily protein YafD